MATIVIGGHSRSVGKTSVVAGLISALSERRWLAVKITQFGPGGCSSHGIPCDCAVNDQLHSFAINEERDRSGDSDTSRFLVAGADRALWVRTRKGFLAEAMPALRAELTRAQDVIIESNSVIQFLRPDLYVTVLDPATTDFKDSARTFLDRADAVILHSAGDTRWSGVSLRPVANSKIFRITPPPYVTDEVIAWVRERIDLVSPSHIGNDQRGIENPTDSKK